MEIKILGKGCPKCKKLEEIARSAAEEAGLEATIIHVTEMDEILSHDVAMTPGLVIDGEVKSSGRIPPKGEVIAWIRGASA
ncbi:MAG: thioredoxin family protein [Anaerolineae bacterium]